jgi:hypothetical protein
MLIQEDKYSYERRKAARRLGVPESELEDEPDFDTRIDMAEVDW